MDEDKKTPMPNNAEPIPDNSYRNRWIDPSDKDPETSDTTDKPIPENLYPVIDSDAARDNIENHISEADLQDI